MSKKERQSTFSSNKAIIIFIPQKRNAKAKASCEMANVTQRFLFACQGVLLI